MPGRKNQSKRRPAKRRVRGRRSNAQQVLATGVGKTVTRAFGNTAACAKGWDAFHPSHLPLPRPVAPYTVVRTTVLIKNSALVNIFGTTQNETGKDGAMWTPVVGLSSNDPDLPINALDNTRIYKVPDPCIKANNFTCVPSAMSVQCMNPEALQTASGIIAGAVSNTQCDMAGVTGTWRLFADNFVSYQRPRLMAASKLALRGVQADSMPLNMNKCSEFTTLDTEFTNDENYSWLETGTRLRGWSPIVFINNSGKDLDFLVTIEWRVRFDMTNPAVSSHTDHGFTSDKTWHDMIQRHVSLGHGMVDIAERVANIGAAAYGMYRGASAIGARVLPLFGA